MFFLFFYETKIEHDSFFPILPIIKKVYLFTFICIFLYFEQKLSSERNEEKNEKEENRELSFLALMKIFRIFF